MSSQYKFSVTLLVGILVLNGCAPLNKQASQPALHPHCAATIAPNLPIGHHAIIAHSDGEPQEPVNDHGVVSLKPGRMQTQPNHDGQETEYDSYLRAMIADLKAHAPPGKDGKRHILVFIHGGMNEKQGALARSARLSSCPELTNEYYPIFIDWNSAPLSTYWEHLVWVRQGQHEKFIGPITAPFYLLADIARGVTRAPGVWAQMINYQLQGPESPAKEKSHDRMRVALSHEAVKYQQKIEGGPEVTQKAARDLSPETPGMKAESLVHTMFYPAKMVTSTLIDTIGTGAWDMMVRRSEELFNAPTRWHLLKPEQRQELERYWQKYNRREPLSDYELKRISQIESSYLARSRQGAVELFLRELAKELGPEKHRYSIILVGHSMGAIISCEMVRRHPELPFDDIVFLAAACTVKQCEDTVIPYLRTNRQAQFYNVTLHPYADIRESTSDTLGPACVLVPRGSLLEWLDAFFTNPSTREDRMLGKWRNAITSPGIFPPDVARQVHLKMFAYGDNSVPQRHGAFASEKLATRFWMKDFRDPNKPLYTDSLR